MVHMGAVWELQSLQPTDTVRLCLRPPAVGYYSAELCVASRWGLRPPVTLQKKTVRVLTWIAAGREPSGTGTTTSMSHSRSLQSEQPQLQEVSWWGGSRWGDQDRCRKHLHACTSADACTLALFKALMLQPKKIIRRGNAMGCVMQCNPAATSVSARRALTASSRKQWP